MENIAVEKEAVESRSDSTGQQINMRFVTLVAIVAALGGLLFGFDTAAVSGAIGFMKIRFGLNQVEVGWAVSCLIVGCIFGAAGAGGISDKFGRKKVLYAGAVLYLIGSVGAALSPSFSAYVIARLVSGLGIGITATLAPLYNAEIAPAKYRGRLVALNQVAIVSGILLVYFLNLFIAGLGDDAWDISTAWRWMFGVGAVPSILFIILLFFVPESPRWLIKQGRPADSLPILLRIHGEELARKEVLDIKASFNEKQATMREMLSDRGLRAILIVGIVVALTQQITGINAVMYYAPEIFKAAGAGTDASLLQTILVGLINLVFTLVSIWLIDKVGRKALVLVGSSMMTISLAVIGIAFHTGHTAGPLVMIFILLYVASFAISLGTAVWVLLSEIFPNRIRGIATAIANMALWAANYVVTQAFPPLLNTIGSAPTFWIFGAMGLFTFLFMWRVVPETKGKSLEEIESIWIKADRA
ncbi:sugar porter family MFS transporter [Paenibacillus beijingensis]|uniref:MFS transporter n=1 Tax=Paenibacillus beijingensis TaxID=1126833 RepID=A0A0D5NNW9_9BACL|nr:sugar porter family MFS transporter [Paenibacillus beijingensis]AJY77019.1 MFS transporter [Paenibacillus beijingensis]